MNKHILHIIINGVRTFIIPFTLFVVSYIIVNIYNKELWGEFVIDLLFINLIAHFLQWGNKEYLIRSFSEKPSQLQALFYQNLYTRALFLLPAFVMIVAFNLDLNKAFLLFFWVLGLFLYQSAESLIIYSKKFKNQVVAEIVALTSIIVFFSSKEIISTNEIIQMFVISTWLKTIIILVQLYPKPTSVIFSFKELMITLPFFIIGFSGLLQSRIDQYIIALFCDKEVVGSYQIFLSAFILLQALSAIIVVPFNQIIYRININVFNKIQRKVSLFSALLVVVLGSFISWGLHFFYQINVHPIYFLTGILFAFPAFIYGPIIFLFYRVKQEKEIMLINYVGAAFNLILTLVLVFYGNPFSAVIASAIAQWLMLGWYIYRKKAIINEIELSKL